jgi:hypothetical protein
MDTPVRHQDASLPTAAVGVPPLAGPLCPAGRVLGEALGAKVVWRRGVHPRGGVVPLPMC